MNLFPRQNRETDIKSGYMDTEGKGEVRAFIIMCV